MCSDGNVKKVGYPDVQIASYLCISLSVCLKENTGHLAEWFFFCLELYIVCLHFILLRGRQAPAWVPPQELFKDKSWESLFYSCQSPGSPRTPWCTRWCCQNNPWGLRQTPVFIPPDYLPWWLGGVVMGKLLQLSFHSFTHPQWILGAEFFSGLGFAIKEDFSSWEFCYVFQDGDTFTANPWTSSESLILF